MQRPFGRGVSSILLAALTWAVGACNVGPCPSSLNTIPVPLTIAGGGSFNEQSGCEAACNLLRPNSLGWTSCAFVASDGGNTVDCTGQIETCP
jgi:hypothetical protein